MSKKPATELLDSIAKYTVKPALFTPSEPADLCFWDDPHIAKSMLEAHLNPTYDSASRRPETIDKEVNHLVASGLLKSGGKILDLGCGPGLYAGRLAAKGFKVTGIDISQNSLDYATAQARKSGMDIDFRRLNFLDLDYSGEFDAVVQVFGEIGVFSDENRDALLGRIHTALKPDGLFIFDVTTPSLKQNPGSENSWSLADGGFWRPGRYLTLELRFDYPEENVFVNQFIVLDDESTAVYRIWNHNYTPETITPVLEKAGFRVLHTWNNLSGEPYQSGGEWLAIAAQKV